MFCPNGNLAILNFGKYQLYIWAFSITFCYLYVSINHNVQYVTYCIKFNVPPKKNPKKSFFHAHAESCEFTIDHAEWCVICIITCRVVWFIIAHADTYVMVQFVFIFLFHMQSHEIQYFIANKIKCLEHSLSSTCIKQSYSNIKSVLKS